MVEDIDIRGELVRLRDQEPFEPFTLVMASGDRYKVSGPDEIALAQHVITIVPHRRIGHSSLRFNQLSSIDAYEAI
jgi:hypothetical protein